MNSVIAKLEKLRSLVVANRSADRNMLLIVNPYSQWMRLLLIIVGYGIAVGWTYVGYFNEWFGGRNVSIALAVLSLVVFLLVAIALVKLTLNRHIQYPIHVPQDILDQMVKSPQVQPHWMRQPTAPGPGPGGYSGRTQYPGRQGFGAPPSMTPPPTFGHGYGNTGPFNTQGFGRNTPSPTVNLVQFAQLGGTAVQLDVLYNHLFATGKLDPQTMNAWCAVRDELIRVTPIVVPATNTK